MVMSAVESAMVVMLKTLPLFPEVIVYCKLPNMPASSSVAVT